MKGITFDVFFITLVVLINFTHVRVGSLNLFHGKTNAEFFKESLKDLK
jgi:hypothetical protein